MSGQLGIVFARSKACSTAPLDVIVGFCHYETIRKEEVSEVKEEELEIAYAGWLFTPLGRPPASCVGRARARW
jgi:hypothetical protein